MSLKDDQKMFGGLYFNTTVYLSKILYWINPYDPNRDKLSIIRNGYGKNLVTNISSSGVMEITLPGDPVSVFDWDKVINMPAYRLNVDVKILNFFNTFLFSI